MNKLTSLTLAAMLVALAPGIPSQAQDNKPVATASLPVDAEGGEFGAYKPSTGWMMPKDPLVLKRLRKWQDLKFGVLICWQHCTQWGVDSWTLCPERFAWNDRKDYINNTPEGAEQDDLKYRASYEALAKTFKPVDYDPEKWAEMLQKAGVKYAVIMAKHHDGFCLWDTATTDYKTTSKDCPFSKLPGADTMKSLSDALRKHGLRVGIYFSKPDWHSPYFWSPDFPIFPPGSHARGKGRDANYSPIEHPELWKKFKDFTWTQVEELMTKYGEVDSLWLDGGWVRPAANNQDLDMDGLAAMARKHQPGLMVVDRTIKGPNENYTTPEGVGAFPKGYLPHPWEANFPIAKNWNYRPNDEYKSTGALVRYLCRSAAWGGNFLLGIAPDSKGSFDPQITSRMEGMGVWLQLNGEAIYGTRAKAPYEQGDCVFTTKPDGTIYAIVLSKEDTGTLPATVSLPGQLAAKAATITLLGYGSLPPAVTQDGKTIVTIPVAARSASIGAYAWTVKLTFNK